MNHRKVMTLYAIITVFTVFVGCGGIYGGWLGAGDIVGADKPGPVMPRVYGTATNSVQPVQRPMPASRDSTGQRRVAESVYQVYTMTVTAYSRTGQATTSGAMPRKGLVAADWSQLPKGTKLFIEGYGYAEVADTGSLIKAPGNRPDKRKRYAELDLYYSDESDAVKWGRRQVRVWVYK